MADSRSKGKKIDPVFFELALPVGVQETIMQPNKVTTASMSYNKRQMDILILIMAHLKGFMSEILMRGIHVEQLDIFREHDARMFTFNIPIKEFGVSANRYAELKQDLAKMAVIPIRFQQIDPETGQRIEFVSGFYTARMPVAWGRSIQIQIHKDILKHFIDVSKGFTKYNQKVALALKTTYAKRLYMFISKWKDKGGTVINMDSFREMMDVVEKYPNYKDLYRWVIKPSYEKLKEKADCWFEVSPCYREGENQPYQLVFKIISLPKNAFEEHKLEIQKTALRGNMINLGLTAAHIHELLEKIHPGNIVATIGKVDELVQSFIDNKDVIDRDAYYYKAICNFLTD